VAVKITQPASAGFFFGPAFTLDKPYAFDVEATERLLHGNRKEAPAS
jgi:hypothetical protein